MVSTVRILLASLVLLAVVPGRALAGTAVHCGDIVPRADGPSPARPVAPADLVRLRDIGPVDPFSLDARLFTLSPDGRRIAFQLRQADPARNTYCLAMVVLDLRDGAPPRLVDTGGEFLRIHFDFRDKANFPTGIARPITPRWSSDGRWIAYLKRADGLTQVWRAFVDGSGAMPITRSASDVEDFRLSPDGRRLIFSRRPALDVARRAIDREGLSGFHYDDRFAPMASDRPFPIAPIAREVVAQDLETGAIRPATAGEIASLPASPIMEAAWTEADGPNRRKAWLVISSATFAASHGRLMAEPRNGKAFTCTFPACADASRPWWTPDGRVRFFHEEGWARGSVAIYEWTPGAGAPRRLYLTDDVLSDCQPDGDTLLCLREASLTPRRLERLDPATGHRTVIFDPNPEFGRLRKGRVERLHVRNAFGLPSIADLVLPVGYRVGTRFPLVAVQYQTRGFLRGGTGDDYPIQAFAARGYAVLSVSRPDFTGAENGKTDVVTLERGNLAEFSNRRSELSSIETGVRLAIERGIADPEQIGLTGMSDGATVAAYALLHSKTFAAVAMSSCCFDTTFPTRVGPVAARHFHDVGYPRMTDEAGAAFWRQISLSRNARAVRTPTLLQVSDDEYMSALESFTALREVNAPIDLFLFPGEHHVKWQPAHRLAMYQRTLDWFDFWLRDKTPLAPDRQDDVKRWEALRKTVPPAL
jgi:dipeptidyl aminopeptidase/acylaminoacyl peptidase